jgi:hypothetical protein
MKELERKDARLDLDERNREVQRFNDDGFEDCGVEFIARVGA